MNSNFRVLIIEDNTDIAENISDCLISEGFITDFAMDGIGGIHLALTNSYDVIILDLMLPGMDGITLCKQLRTQGASKIPVLMLTARDTLADKLQGFDVGADDYLVKPFEMDELIARIKVLCKRSVQNQPVNVQIEDLTIDIGKRVVKRSETIIGLNPACFKLLVCLVENFPNIVRKTDLEFLLWGDMPPGSNALKSHMYLLRNKIDKDFEKKLIHTIHGVGYQIGNKDA